MGGVVDAVCSDGGQNPHEEAGVKLYKPRPKPHPLKKDYPELFSEKAEAAVVSFGSATCAPCYRQGVELKRYAQGYHVLKVDISEDRWRALFKKWDLGPTVPVTVVVENGEVAKMFRGFTPWREIKPFAKKAVLHEKDDEKGNIDVGPIHIDWDDGDVNVDIRRRKRR